MLVEGPVFYYDSESWMLIKGIIKRLRIIIRSMQRRQMKVRRREGKNEEWLHKQRETEDIERILIKKLLLAGIQCNMKTKKILSDAAETTKEI